MTTETITKLLRHAAIYTGKPIPEMSKGLTLGMGVLMETLERHVELLSKLITAEEQSTEPVKFKLVIV